MAISQNVARCNRYQGYCDMCQECEGYCGFRHHIDNGIVRSAVENIKEMLPDYWKKTLTQRLCTGTGSVYTSITTLDQMEKALLHADWEPANHPAIAPGCKAYVTYDIKGGCYGMISVADQPDDATFIIEDQKGTGKVSLVLQGAGRVPAEETWIIIGKEQGRNIVFTFHPGEPVPRATTSTEELPVGTKLTKAEALALGFNLAKVG